MIDFNNNKIDSRIIEVFQEWLLSNSLSELRFFGYFSLMVNIKEDSSVPTMCVYIDKDGMNLLYNIKFVNYLESIDKLRFLLIHELMHLISKHTTRSIAFNLEPTRSNWAQDMIINSSIIKDYIDNPIFSKYLQFPEGGLLIPDSYKDEPISEVLYDWLSSEDFKKNEPKLSEELKRQEESNLLEKLIEELSEEELNEHYQKIMKSGRVDVHRKDEVESNVASEIVREKINKLKSRGLVPSKVEKYINSIQRRRPDILQTIKKSIDGLSSENKFETYTRLNRRGILGKKGYKRIGNAINVLLDVSGSMDHLIEFVLSYCLQEGLLLNVVQVDTVVQSFDVFEDSNDIRRIKLKGGGGTILQPGIDFISKESKCKGLNTLILTDGFCDRLNFEHLEGKVLILYTNSQVEYENGFSVDEIFINPKEL